MHAMEAARQRGGGAVAAYRSRRLLAVPQGSSERQAVVVAS